MKSFQRLVRWFGLAALLLIVNLSAHAQSAQGTILGHVTDPSGAVVPGAEITITNVDTNMKFVARTSGVGDYLFVNVTPGQYNIEVADNGFKSSHADKVQLDVQATLRQNFTLQLGNAQETVEVAADAQMIQADNATQGGVIESKAIDNLPISGRDFTNLLRLQAGATQVQGSSQLYWAQHGLNNDFASVSINGARTESVSYLVDGITDNDQFFSTANNIPNSEAIAEFKTQSGLYSSEFGQGSAQVNVAIKNGGNQYHGSAYDYFSGDIFQPHNPLYAYEKNVLGENVSTAKDPLKQHQYGFSLGGPITIPHLYNGANHSFFFYSYEVGSRRKSAQSTALVPSTQERSGDFSDWKDASGNLIALYDPTTQTGSNPSTRTAFANNKITSLSTIAKNFLALYPTPNAAKSNMAACVASGCYNYVASVKRPYDTNNQTFRVDHRLNDKNLFYLTAVLGEQKYHNASILPETGSLTYQRNHLYAFNWQRVITPNVVNEARAGYNWQYWVNGADSTGVDWGTKLGFANEVTDSQFYALPTLELSGFTSLGNSNTGWHQKENIYQFVDNLKFVHGRHALTLGLDIRRYLLNMNDAYSSEGDLAFDGRYSTTTPQTAIDGKYGTTGAGSAVADMLLGDPSSLSAPTIYGSDMFNVRGTAWNFFAADDIHLTPKLTINLGVRYELPSSFHSPDGSGITADLSSSTGQFEWASKSNYQLMKTIGATSTWQGYTANDKLTDANHHNIAPRIGFAWRPLDTDKLVIRGGYGLFYDLQNLWYSLTTYDNIKAYLGSSYANASTGETSTAPYPLDTLWQAANTSYSYLTEATWQTGPQINWPHNKSPYNQQWSFGGQYAITQTTLVDINYVGSHGVHQPGYWYYNAAKMPGGTALLSDGTDCNTYRDDADSLPSGCSSLANYSALDKRTPWSNIRTSAYAIANIFAARYNSLQVRLNQRPHDGISYQVNYTWSRTMDEASAINNIANSALSLQNGHCTKCDWGPSSSDQTQRVVGSGTWELPVGKGRRYSVGKIGDYVAGGWDFTGIYTLASGQPLTVLNTDSSARGDDGIRMDLRRPNTTGDPHSNNFTSGTSYYVAGLKNSIYHAFNPTAYTTGAANTYGNTSRNSIRGPFYQRGDIAFSKNFPIHKEHNLAYKFEMFNVFSPWRSTSEIDITNHLNNNSAGSIVSIDTDSNGNALSEANQGGTRHLWNPRVIQMSLKYSF